MKFIVVDDETPTQIHEGTIQFMLKFKHLGSIITSEVWYESEVYLRIVKVTSPVGTLKHNWGTLFYIQRFPYSKHSHERQLYGALEGAMTKAI